MKQTAIIAAAAVAAVGIGASTFLLVRGSSSPDGGAATRDELATRAIAGLNSGDTDALLAILVGPDSDARAADCDEERPSNDAARAKRVADGLAQARSRGLTIDHLGSDQSSVLHEKGAAISAHCVARATIVKHATTLALHDASGAKYVAELTAMEIAGRWFLTQVPAATREGATAKWVAPAIFEPGELVGSCATWWQTLVALRGCPAASEAIRPLVDTLEMRVGRNRRAGWDPTPDQTVCSDTLREWSQAYASCQLDLAPLPAPATVPTRNKVMIAAFNAMDAGDRDALRALFAPDGCARLADGERDKRIADGLAATIRDLAFDRVRVDVPSALCPGVTQHVLTQQFHMPDGTPYAGDMVVLETGGRWYLSALPIAKPRPPSKPADFAGQKQSPEEPDLVLAVGSFSDLSPICARWWKRALELRHCDAIAWARRVDTDAYAFFLQAIGGAKRSDAACQADLATYARDFASCR